MKGWIVADHAGRSYLVRAGVGIVTAVVPVGLPDADGGHAYMRVELDLPRPANGPRAIRYSTSARVPASDPLCAIAMAHAESGEAVAWSIEWHRQDWIPGSILITSLDLATDTEARLVSLDPVTVPVAADLVWEREDVR